MDRGEVSDAVAGLRHLFGGVPLETACEGEAFETAGKLKLLDLNGDGKLDIADTVTLLAFLFQNGPPPVSGTRCIRIEGCPHTCTGR